jgi:uncharacterized protein YuzE
MKITYFPDTDTALVEFSGGEVSETKAIGEDLYLDFDRDGNVVSITIEHARQRASMPEITYRQVESK